MSRPSRFAPLAFGFACGLAMPIDIFGQRTGDEYYEKYQLPTGADGTSRGLDQPMRGRDEPVRDREQPPPKSSSDYFYFPPEPPVFGGKISDAGAALDGPLDQLAEWVGEPFYPSLGTRLRQGALAKGAAAHLARYRAQRDRLRNDLLNHLAASAPLESDARANARRAFARAQTPAIAALETDAESLRDELVRGTLFDTSADWNRGRKWLLDRAATHLPGGYSDNVEFQVTRAAAFFQPGLGAAQRGLIYELAMEEHEKLPPPKSASGPPPTASDPTVIFFSPETARLRLPATLPDELRAKAGAYQHDKDALKRELRDLLVAQEGASDATRRAASQSLTDRQWPRVVALDELAESIRADLAALPPPPPPALPPQLPPEFAGRIHALHDAALALERERLGRIRAHPTSPPGGIPPAAIAETVSDRIPANSSDRIVPWHASDQDFRRENADRYAALASRLRALLADLPEAVAQLTDPDTGRPMTTEKLSQLIVASNAAFLQLGREEIIFRDYRTAMLEPGLSPEQRRLLFTYALAGLAQALPAGEPRPGERFTFAR